MAARIVREKDFELDVSYRTQCPVSQGRATHMGSDSGHEAGEKTRRGVAQEMPRWVKIFGVAAAIAVAAFAWFHLAGGWHGAWRSRDHGRSRDARRPWSPMTMTPDLRKLILSVHVIASVGWAGIVAGFVALAIAGLASADVQLARASYVAMDFTYRTLVIPLGLASLITGVIASLGTEWGLVRHYWVLVKLALTVPAVGLMLVHLDPVRYAARVAAATTFASGDLDGLRGQLLLYACAALAVLLTATVLSTYKPRGRTPRGLRRLASRTT
jgi:hypothetical protein